MYNYFFLHFLWPMAFSTFAAFVALDAAREVDAATAADWDLNKKKNIMKLNHLNENRRRRRNWVRSFLPSSIPAWHRHLRHTVSYTQLKEEPCHVQTRSYYTPRKKKMVIVSWDFRALGLCARQWLGTLRTRSANKFGAPTVCAWIFAFLRYHLAF